MNRGKERRRVFRFLRFQLFRFLRFSPAAYSNQPCNESPIFLIKVVRKYPALKKFSDRIEYGSNG